MLKFYMQIILENNNINDFGENIDDDNQIMMDMDMGIYIKLENNENNDHQHQLLSQPLNSMYNIYIC